MFYNYYGRIGNDSSTCQSTEPKIPFKFDH